ncbi:hypothetical protein ACFWMP_31255 [Paenibacillus sp. NPDC058367]|uniref:hypothetical protein n=1 Tax=Paenibacillus sp. NPDC058367 TaxID=3346460 RepID=UPI00365E369C
MNILEDFDTLFSRKEPFWPSGYEIFLTVLGIVAFFYCVAAIVVIFNDLKVIVRGKAVGSVEVTTTYQDFKNLKEYKLYHLFLLVLELPMWLIELFLIMLCYAVYYVVRTIYLVFWMIFNIKIYKKNS